MTLTLELAQFAVREEDEAALLAERPEMIRALQPEPTPTRLSLLAQSSTRAARYPW
jgi:hypothetical protein